jgi:hypothetical protein
MKSLQLSLVIVFAVVLVMGCADPRQAPIAPGTPAYTRTVVLWEDVASGGTPRSATFVIDRELAAATVTVAGFIMPDSDILHIEAIQNDSIPAKMDTITYFLVRLDSLGPDSLWSPDTTILGLALRDSLQWNIDDTTEMGVRRDSLILLVDDRYVLSVWADVDTTERYPEAIYLDEAGDTLSGQHFYASPSDTVTGMKGRSFQLDLRAWSAADIANEGRPIEINWLSRLIPGEHTISVRMTGSGSRITGTIMLVIGEGEI